MTKEEFDQIATVRDLEVFQQRIVKEMKDLLLDKKNPAKEFYTPKEFSYKTGIPYSTVVYRCNSGKLKARQDDPKSPWQIYTSELDRFKREADDNAA